MKGRHRQWVTPSWPCSCDGTVVKSFLVLNQRDLHENECAGGAISQALERFREVDQ